MRCPYCQNADTQVKDSRPTEDNTAIRRRRSCSGCGGRFTTFERIQARLKDAGVTIPDEDMQMLTAAGANSPTGFPPATVVMDLLHGKATDRIVEAMATFTDGFNKALAEGGPEAGQQFLAEEGKVILPNSSLPEFSRLTCKFKNSIQFFGA